MMNEFDYIRMCKVIRKSTHIELSNTENLNQYDYLLRSERSGVR